MAKSSNNSANCKLTKFKCLNDTINNGCVATVIKPPPNEL